MAATHAIATASGARFWLAGFAWDEAERLCHQAYEQRKGWREHGLDPAVIGEAS